MINRTRQHLSAHAQLTSAAVARYQSTVDHVTRFTGRFERHLAAILDSGWLTFPNTLLNLSLASQGRIVDAVHRRLELGNLLAIDEVQEVANWKQRFWTRCEVCTY